MGHMTREYHTSVHGLMFRSQKMAALVSSQVGYGMGGANKNDLQVNRPLTWRPATTRRFDNY